MNKMNEIKENEKVTMSLITNHIRAIAGKIKSNEKLEDDEQTYAANALTDYADKLERKSKGHSTGAIKGDEANRQIVLNRRILEKHNELLGKTLEKKPRGRPKSLKEK